MRDTRVIDDSEDEDGGSSPDHSPARSTAVGDLTGPADRDKKRADEPTSDSRSTDPEFFKRFYEDQQKATDEVVPGTGQEADGSRGSSHRQERNNSSSITDPMRRSARKGPMGKADARYLADLTQVTTPDAPSARQRDVYDFICDEEGEPVQPAVPEKSKSAVKVSGKRKRRLAETTAAEISPPQLSMRTQESDGEDKPSRPTKKRKSARQETQSDGPDDVALLAVPTSAGMEDIYLCDSNNYPGSTIPNTFEDLPADRLLPPASFFIAPPSRLTASQKQEYLPISSHSELSAGEAHQQPSLPLPDPPTQGQRSTNTESTIAYTTPSRYRSSAAAPPSPVVDDMDGLTTSSPTQAQMDSTRGGRPSRSGRAGPDQWQPQSSPDELNPHLPPAPSRKTRRKRDAAVQDGPVPEEPWNSNKIGYHQEKYVPRPSRLRSRVVEEEESVDHLNQSLPDTCPPGDATFEGGDDAQPILISSEQQTPKSHAETVEGLDPEFLAALPEDLRQEVISDHITQRSARTSQAARTRSRGLPAEPASERLSVLKDAPQPKKRGRKKKEVVVAAAAEEQNDDEAPVTPYELQVDPSPAPTATTRRKRGRPKKAEAFQPPSDRETDHTCAAAETAAPVPATVDEPDPTEALAVESAQDSSGRTKAPPRRGRKKKAVEEALAPPARKQSEEEPSHDTHDDSTEDSVRSAEDSGESAETGGQREALRDISNTSSQNAAASSVTTDKVVSGDGGEERQPETTPEPKAKEVPKSAAANGGQQGKVPLRVGLSKKSRIAPLLKIIRK